MFGGSIYLFTWTDYAWWLYPALFLVPDISMLGYLVNNRIGAISYNLFHHKGIAIVLLLYGVWDGPDWMFLSGIILLGHASFDRILGYGLKYGDSFHHTHLGMIGKKS